MTASRGFTSLPDGLDVIQLSVCGCTALRSLPRGLRCTRLLISGTPITHLPPDLMVRDVLDARTCTQLTSLPAGLRLHTLIVAGCTRLEALPPDLLVYGQLDVSGCVALKRLPDVLQAEWIQADGCIRLQELPHGTSASVLSLRGCSALRELPEELEAQALDISGCTALTSWPRRGLRALSRLSMRNCTGMQGLPRTARTLDLLDIAGCTGLRELPERLRITGGLEVADTALVRIPARLRRYLRWRGVAVSERIVLHPETITASEVLNQWNAEVRRVMIERVGYERFMLEAGARVVDEDYDTGGPRQLLRVNLDGDEPLVCLSVYDPSTGRQYLLRVPPDMASGLEAAAWIAGFDDPDDYQPEAET